ncbi:helix-turn-helix domain-containing protein [Bacillus alkalicellulosilyticus]|uniref:helix-turn-helix domain-containing protein n=1 Tax=Alkalihalobacterium alkalicellulosilyticum TaxID=1912214 RepID=UPI000998D3E7|nr:helix-turn-helix domain-containing protein [Bacillus alkalicellulosilyticus]
MTIIEGIFLTIANQFAGNRSIYGIYHLLKGKRSSQTIQDGYLFHCHHLFGVIPYITRETILSVKEELLQKEMIISIEEDRVMLTEFGEEYKRTFLEKNSYISSLQGWKHKDIDLIFWQRLSLYIQCLSMFEAGQTSFIPITKNQTVLTWVKQHFPANKKEQTNQLRRLYLELHRFLKEIEPVQAVLFTKKVTGYQQIGLTTEQISEELNLTKEEVRLRFFALIHSLLDYISAHQESCPLLREVSEQKRKTFHLTTTATVTYSFVKKGKTISEIASERKLKQNTIEDHIVEIAIEDPLFSITSYLTDEQKMQIENAVREKKTKRLRDIKAHVDPEITYFQIRLVLTRMEVMK